MTFSRIISNLKAWRDADHADIAVLSRHEVVTLLEGAKELAESSRAYLSADVGMAEFSRLSLALHAYGNGFEIKGKDECDCGEADTCKKCFTVEEYVTSLKEHLKG